MVHTEQLNAVGAEQYVQQGSDIVVVPYSSYMNVDESIRLSVYTRMAAHAAVQLYERSATPDTTVVAVGEHTYGSNQTSTTKLIYDFMAGEGLPETAFATERPVDANATPQQIDWLRRTYGEQWQEHAPVLIGHEPHWERIEYLCGLYRLPAGFVDAAHLLAATGDLTPEYAEASRLYKEENQRYEDQASRLTRSIAWMGPVATTQVFRALARMRSPNVVDVVDTAHGAQFYASPARRHKRRTVQKDEK
ncbi:MAG: hypothetical protein ABWY71_03165 [Candidatus Saccharimonadales bacterium]